MRFYFALLLGLLFGSLAQAQVTQIFLAHAQQHDVSTDTAAAVADEFRRQVGIRSDGRLKVEILPDGLVGGNRDTTALVEKGIIHSALVTLPGVAPVYKPLSLIHLPYAFDNLETARRVFAGPFGQQLADGMASQTALRLLGFISPSGFHIITNSRREIRNPEHLRGLRIRAIPGASALDAMLKSVGAEPVKVSSREELATLANGAIDGQMSPASVTLARGLDGAQRYATLSKHVYAPYVWIFNRKALESLPEADASIITQAASAAIEKGHALALALQNSPQGITGLRKRLQVYEPSASERAAFAALMRPASEKAIIAEIGEQGETWMRAYLTAIAEAEKGKGKK